MNQPPNLLPAEYSLSQNYPNPFNPVTTIEFFIPKSEFVDLRIHDILGKEIETLVSEVVPGGSHKVSFNAKNLPSNINFYKITAGNFTQINKMLLIR